MAMGPVQIPQQPQQGDTGKRRASFLLSVRASVLRDLGITVFRGQGALVEEYKNTSSVSVMCVFV